MEKQIKGYAGTPYVTGGFDDLLNEFIGFYVLTNELIASVNRINYFTFHFKRCKKESDKIKLTLILVCHTVHSAHLVLLINNLVNSKFHESKNDKDINRHWSSSAICKSGCIK